jgi:D-alanyl-D-alanine carboxypeptidase
MYRKDFFCGFRPSFSQFKNNGIEAIALARIGHDGLKYSLKIGQLKNRVNNFSIIRKPPISKPHYQKYNNLLMVRESLVPARKSRGRQASITAFLMLALFGYLPVVNAKYAAILIDAESGRVLHEVNADTLNYPASLTKMMTLYMVFSALESKKITLDTRWKVSAAAAVQPPTKLGLRRGQTITVRDCILALVTQSANDIAVVVAEGLAGSETRFARMMTAKSRELNMTRTTFQNASGLPNRGQTTTARDISRLSLALLRDFPGYYDYFSTRVFRYGRRAFHNHNGLLISYKGMDGIKTGYIRASGYNLAASAVRNGRRLIGVVMGGTTSRARNQQMAALLDRGFASLANETPPSIQTASKIQLQTASGANKSYPPSPQVPVPAIPATVQTAPRFTEPMKQSLKPDWGVQVGAFSYFKPAQSAASRARINAPELLGTSRTVISPLRGRKGVVYRAQLTGIVQHQARKACELLRSKRIACITLPPSNRQTALTLR